MYVRTYVHTYISCLGRLSGLKMWDSKVLLLTMMNVTLMEFQDNGSSSLSSYFRLKNQRLMSPLC